MFQVPTGRHGKAFVTELAHLFRAYAEATAYESIAMKATTVMCLLLLHKPHRTSKAKDHAHCLQRRLESWKAGDIDTLLGEGRTIQQRIQTSNQSPNQTKRLARSFAKLMLEGKTKAALRLITEQDKGGFLHLNNVVQIGSAEPQTVLDILRQKHPVSQPAHPDALLQAPDTPNTVHSVLYDRIDAAAIRSAAGPSAIDACGWRRMCTSFQTSSDELCHSLALLARRLCTECVDPAGLAPFLACRLITLDKNLGVCPIWICEVARRIIAKANLQVIGDDIQKAAGCVQLCAGQSAGTEAAVHAMHSAYACNSEATETVLLVDAFNSLNRQVALHNIDICVLPWLQFSSTLIVRMPIFLLMARHSTHTRVQPRETL